MSHPVDTNVLRHYPGPGIANVGSYQMGGIPFASSSIRVPPTGSGVEQVEFPWVTKFVTVINANSGTNAPLRVGFSDLGVRNASNIGHNSVHSLNLEGQPMGNNYWFVLNNGESYTAEWRIGELWLMGHLHTNGASQPCWTTASIIAGLTGIRTKEIPAISGNLGSTFIGEDYTTIGNWSGSIGVG